MSKHRWTVGRGAIRAVLLVVAQFGGAPANAQDVARWRPYIDEASLRFGVPTRWIEQVMRAESAGWTMLGGRPIRSRAGAIGLMQLMPATWGAMRSRLQLGMDPDDPRDNILAGSFYLRLLYDRFGYPGLFAAYNAGPARYGDYLANRQALPRETIAYLQSVAGSPPRIGAAGAAAPPALFAVRRDIAQDPNGPAPDVAARPGLFALQSNSR